MPVYALSRSRNAVLQKFASGFSGNYLPALIQRENGKSWAAGVSKLPASMTNRSINRFVFVWTCNYRRAKKKSRQKKSGHVPTTNQRVTIKIVNPRQSRVHRSCVHRTILHFYQPCNFRIDRAALPFRKCPSLPRLYRLSYKLFIYIYI